MIYKYFKYTKDNCFIHLDPCYPEPEYSQMIENILSSMGGTLIIFLEKTSDRSNNISLYYTTTLTSEEYKKQYGKEFMPSFDLDDYTIYEIDNVKEDRIDKILHKKGLI